MCNVGFKPIAHYSTHQCLSQKDVEFVECFGRRHSTCGNAECFTYEVPAPAQVEAHTQGLRNIAHIFEEQVRGQVRQPLAVRVRERRQHLVVLIRLIPSLALTLFDFLLGYSIVHSFNRIEEATLQVS